MKHSERAPIYEVVQSEVSIEEAGQCTTYGIACVFKDSTAGRSQAITIADISVDRALCGGHSQLLQSDLAVASLFSARRDGDYPLNASK